MSVKRSFDTGIIYNIHRKNTLPGGTTMSELSDKIRSEFKKADDERDALMNTPEDIERWDNIVYGHDDREMQRLDVYRPKQAQGEDLPIIISVHGGARMYGDKERYQYYCMSLAQRGFAVVNFTYRLAPARFITHLHTRFTSSNCAGNLLSGARRYVKFTTANPRCARLIQ